jgi:hypothetical protein
VNSTNIWVQFRKAIESFTLNMTENRACEGWESGATTIRRITTKVDMKTITLEERRCQPGSFR